MLAVEGVRQEFRERLCGFEGRQSWLGVWGNLGRGHSGGLGRELGTGALRPNLSTMTVSEAA